MSMVGKATTSLSPPRGLGSANVDPKPATYNPSRPRDAHINPKIAYLTLTIDPFSPRAPPYTPSRDPNPPAFAKTMMPHMADLTPFLERNPVVAIVLTLILLRFVRILCNRLLENMRKK